MLLWKGGEWTMPKRPARRGEHPHAVGAPHEVGRRGDNGPLVHFHLTLPPAVGREQPLRAHQAQHPRPGDPDPVEDPQPRVDLAMALTLER